MRLPQPNESEPRQALHLSPHPRGLSLGGKRTPNRIHVRGCGWSSTRRKPALSCPAPPVKPAIAPYHIILDPDSPQPFQSKINKQISPTN